LDVLLHQAVAGSKDVIPVPSSQERNAFIARVVNLAIEESRNHKLGTAFEVKVPEDVIPEGIQFSDIRGVVEVKASRSGLVTMGSSGWTYRFFKQ
jgi:hypothetical protein